MIVEADEITLMELIEGSGLSRFYWNGHRQFVDHYALGGSPRMGYRFKTAAVLEYLRQVEGPSGSSANRLESYLRGRGQRAS